jgi:hypothetical protein
VAEEEALNQTLQLLELVAQVAAAQELKMTQVET